MKRLVALLACAALGACAGESTAPSLRILTQVIVVEGDSQVGVVHTALPKTVSVRVLDDRDKPVSGQAVVWKVTKGGGSTFAGFGLTNDSGVAREQWTLGDTTGIQLLEARAIDSAGKPVVFGIVTATANPGPMVYQGFTTSRIIVPADSAILLPIDSRDAFGNATARPTPVMSDAARFGAPDAAGKWTPLALGDVRFVLGTDTLRVQVRWPAHRYRTSTDSGSLLLLGIDTVNVVGGSGCTLSGNVRYAAGGRFLFLRVCEFPGWTMSDLYVNASLGQPGSFYAPLRSESAARWVYPLPGGDSLVVTP
jgi:hypothetical protein